MIGNDVVDLNLAFSTTNRNRKGYLQKLFTTPEQAIILNSSDPDKDLWLLWAMKEATYKAHQRRFNLPRSFNPTRFSCEIGERRGTSVYGIVKVETLIYFTKTSVKTDYLHSISSAEKDIKYIARTMSDSSDIRSSVIHKMSELKDLPKEKIIIKKDQNFIPHISLENQLLEQSFSLSHHGRFSAYALALMNY